MWAYVAKGFGILSSNGAVTWSWHMFAGQKIYASEGVALRL